MHKSYDLVLLEEVADLLYSDTVRQSSQLEYSVQVSICEVLRQFQVCGLALPKNTFQSFDFLLILKVQILFISHLVEFNPSVSNVFALSLIESLLAFCFILE